MRFSDPERWIERLYEAVREGDSSSRYERLEELGRGGMAVVYRGWDRKLNREVALKVLRDDLEPEAQDRARFLREAEAAARLSHPNIVTLLDTFEENGRLVLVMERIHGSPWRPSNADIGLLEKVARAVHYAHSQGVVHRDLKPSNILVTPEGEPKVADFGIAHLLDSSRLTQSGSVMGTPAYMAPEQTIGRDGRITVRTDVYALGVLLYEAMTGRVPFDGTSAVEVLRRIADEPITPPRKSVPSASRDLETVCLKALEKDPRRRYATAEEFAEELLRCREGRPIRAKPLSTLGRLGRRLRKHRATILPILAATTLALGLVAWFAVSAARASKKEKVAQREAERLLEKSHRVATVLHRWSRLQAPLRRMEEVRYDSSLTLEEMQARCAGAWTEIQRFQRDTPDDSASQATMRALAGWARHLAGHDEEGVRWMRDATSIDPEVPLGALMEAFFRFYCWVGRVQAATVEIQEDRMTLSMRSCLGTATTEHEARLGQLLQQLSLARVWGKEGREDFDSLVRGMKAAQAGDFAGADSAFTAALAAPDLRVFETDLNVFRAWARRCGGDGQGSVEDVQAALQARPRWGFLHCHRGICKLGLALETQRRGEDPRSQLDDAIAALDRAFELGDQPDVVRVWRGLAYLNRGCVEGPRHVDPRPSFERAVLDFTVAMESGPGEAFLRTNRAFASLQMGRAKSTLGGDPSPDYQRAIDDLTEAIRLDSTSPLLRRYRGESYLTLAESSEKAADLYAKAIQDLDEAVRMNPEDATARFQRGYAHIGRFLQNPSSRDPLAPALSDLTESIRIAPERARPYFWRGRVHGASSLWREAIEDYNRFLAREERWDGFVYRAEAYLMLAVREAKAGNDSVSLLESCRTDVEKAKALSPTHWEIHKILGDYHDCLRQYAEAVAAYEEAIRLHPKPTQRLRDSLNRSRAKLEGERKK